MDIKTAIVFLIIGFILGAITHEKDLARNFKKYNDAKAWVFPIKSTVD